MTTYLTRDQVLAPRPLPVEDVDVPEWGGTVRVQGLSANQRDAFVASISARDEKGVVTIDNTDFTSKLLAKCLVNADGTPLCRDAADVVALSLQSAAALHRCGLVAQRLSGLGESPTKALAGN